MHTHYILLGTIKLQFSRINIAQEPTVPNFFEE